MGRLCSSEGLSAELGLEEFGTMFPMLVFVLLAKAYPNLLVEGC